MTISKDFSSKQVLSAKDTSLSSQFSSVNLGLDIKDSPLTAQVSKDEASTGSTYGNSVQMDDSMINPSTLPLSNFELLPIYTELNELDDSFSSFKGLNSLFSKFSTSALSVTGSGVAPRSYMSVFNHFRSDYEDFS